MIDRERSHRVAVPAERCIGQNYVMIHLFCTCRYARAAVHSFRRDDRDMLMARTGREPKSIDIDSGARYCQPYREWSKRLTPTMRQTHLAGDKLFVDWAGGTMPIIDVMTGEMQEAHIFVAVLGASSYTYCEARWTETLPDWIGAHVNALDFFWRRDEGRGARQSQGGDHQAVAL
jgi:hypothetical protein